jgi:hypothetical protein
MEWNYNMTDYMVHYQYYNSKSQQWDYAVKIFNSEAKAKEFGAEILREHPENEILIKGKEYRIFYENEIPVKKYIGREHFIVKSTRESREKLLQEMYQVEAGADAGTTGHI